MKKFRAWAIDTRMKDIFVPSTLIGRYGWFGVCSREIPSHLEGCMIALFMTRKLAREHLPLVKKAFPKAIEIPVEITIKEIKYKRKKRAKHEISVLKIS